MASSSPSTSTTLDYDPYEGIQAVRGRGIGRSRGRGRSGQTSRGRGRGTRGKRVQRGERLDADRSNFLRKLKEDRKRKANEMIDELTEEGAKRILRKAAEKVPALLLDVADELSATEPPPDPEDNHSGRPSWCVCEHCVEMPTDREKVCCGMRPDLCSSTRPEMELFVLEPIAIQINQLYRNDIFARHARTDEDLQKSRRHAAYRIWILHEYGKLGYKDRRVVPSCVTWKVRRTYPDPHGHYVGFIPSW